MPDTEITDLVEDTSPAALDYVVTVDVSDTSMSASGSNKKVKLVNLVGALAISPGGSTGELQWNNAGAFAGAAWSTIAPRATCSRSRPRVSSDLPSRASISPTSCRPCFQVANSSTEASSIATWLTGRRQRISTSSPTSGSSLRTGNSKGLTLQSSVGRRLPTSTAGCAVLAMHRRSRRPVAGAGAGTGGSASASTSNRRSQQRRPPVDHDHDRHEPFRLGRRRDRSPSARSTPSPPPRSRVDARQRGGERFLTRARWARCSPTRVAIATARLFTLNVGSVRRSAASTVYEVLRRGPGLRSDRCPMCSSESGRQGPTPRAAPPCSWKG